MNNTLQNGFAVLELLARRGDECAVKEIALQLGLPQSHACRLLKTLKETGYVVQNPDNRRYRIGLKVLCLSNARLRGFRLRNVARPYLQELARELQRPVFLGAAEFGFSVIVATAYPDLFVGDAGVEIGQLHSVNRSACGKVCAAYDVEGAELDALLDHGDWSRSTANSVTDRAAFCRELEQIRRQGYSMLAGERSAGVGAVAAPIFGAERRFYGAVGVIMPHGEENWNDELWQRFISATRRSAAAISFAIGCPVVD